MPFRLYIWTAKQTNFSKSFTLFIQRSGFNMMHLFNKLYYSNFFCITIRNIQHMCKSTLSISRVQVQMSRFRLLYIRVVHRYKMYNFDYGSNRIFLIRNALSATLKGSGSSKHVYKWKQMWISSWKALSFAFVPFLAKTSAPKTHFCPSRYPFEASLNSELIKT